MPELRVLREVDLTLDLVPNMELEAGDKVCAVAEYMEMSADKIDEVRMAVIEACINALEHSGAEDRHLYMNLAVMGRAKPELLRITVKDRGVGFDPEKLVQPRIEEKINASSKRGWGLKIIEGLMDRVDVLSSNEGTAVVMSKAR